MGRADEELRGAVAGDVGEEGEGGAEASEGGEGGGRLELLGVCHHQSVAW